MRTRDQDYLNADAGGRRTESRQEVTAFTYVDRREPPIIALPPAKAHPSKPRPPLQAGGPRRRVPRFPSSFFHPRQASL